MKILINCLNTRKGGAERVISILSNKFVEENEVILLTTMNTKEEYEFNKKIKRYHLDKKNYLYANKIIKKIVKLSPKRLIKMYKIVVNERPDIIISFLPEPSFRIMLLKKISKKVKKIPVIISIRNDPTIEYKNKILKSIMKFLYKDVNGMVFQTQKAKNYFDNIIKTSNKIIIPNPIDEKFFIKSKEDVEKENIIISVGRLEKQKNHKILIDAFYNANKINDSFILNIYGSGSLESKLKKQIKELKLEDKVFLKGDVKSIEEELNKAKIFVLTSNYEGMPNSLMEAMTIGLPCISTNCPCGGPRELIKNNYNGILIDVGDTKALEEKMKEVLLNKEFAEKLSNNAKQSMEKYHPKIINKMWYDYMIKVIDAK